MGTYKGPMTPTLTAVLEDLGLHHRPRKFESWQGKEVWENGPGGKKVWEGTAGDCWAWLRETGQLS